MDANPIPAGESFPFGGLLGPQSVDNAIRQAMSLCWMLLPAERRTVSDLRTEMLRITERALSNLEEDAARFQSSPLAAGGEGVCSNIISF